MSWVIILKPTNAIDYQVLDVSMTSRPYRLLFYAKLAMGVLPLTTALHNTVLGCYNWLT